MPSLWIAISEKLRGANGSPSTWVTRTVIRGGRPAFSASTRSPACAPPASDTANSDRSFFSTPCSHMPPGSCRSTPSTSSSPRGSTFIGIAIQPCPASSVRASTRSPIPSDPFLRSRTRSFGAGVSASHRSGTAQILPPSSTSMTRRTVTFGTPPILWNARPGALSISPSSAMSFNKALSRILSCAVSPKARAISRLPAGVSEVAMKSRICSRVGRPFGMLGVRLGMTRP